MPTTGDKPAQARVAVGVAWVLALGAVVFSRYRGSWASYRNLHQWLADRGVSDFVRNLDDPLIMLAGIALAAMSARVLADVRPCNALAVRRGQPGWTAMTVAAAAPLVLGGLVLRFTRHGSLDLGALALDFLEGVVLAPVLEELLFRGVLVGLPLVLFGDRAKVFWPFAVASAICFGLIHATWTAAGLAAGWMNVLVAGLGGAWFAWLMRAWRSLFVPVLLHATMNLGWMLAGGAGGAGGGGLAENALRTVTIVIATAWTIGRATAASALP